MRGYPVTTISFELKEEQEKKIEEYMNQFSIDKPTAVYKILEIGIKEAKKHFLLVNYRKNVYPLILLVIPVFFLFILYFIYIYKI